MGEPKGKKLALVGAIVFGVLLLTAIVLYRVIIASVIQHEARIRLVTEPASVEEARQGLDFPFPDDAKEILYAEYTQWIAYECMVKFQAPLKVCRSHAIAVLEWHNRNHPDCPVPIELKEIRSVPSITPAHPPLNVTWFDVHSISKGLVAGSDGSNEPKIWIDSERNLFYYRCRD